MKNKDDQIQKMDMSNLKKKITKENKETCNKY